MNRFLSVWLSSLSKRMLTTISIIAVVSALIFLITRDPVFLSLEALAIGIGLLIYFKNRSQGVDGGLISDSTLMNKRYLSFQLSSGMSRKEYVDSYSLIFLMLMPLIFIVFLAIMWSIGDTLKENLVFAATLTMTLFPLFYVITYHNICTMTGSNDTGRFILMALMFVILFFGTFLCIIFTGGSRFFYLFISIIISLVSTLKLRELSIVKMLDADI